MGLSPVLEAPLFEVPGFFPRLRQSHACGTSPPRRRFAGHEGEGMANDVSNLSVQKREQSGKGPAHRLRAKGLIPAICYGPYDKPLLIAVDPEAIKKAIATPHKFNTVIKLQIDGTERTVLFKDYEKDP